MSHDCSKLLEKIFLILDGEMSLEEEKVFLKEIAECNGCLKKYDIEKSFKEFLCRKVNKKHVSNDIVSSIKSKISDFRIQGNAGI